MPMQIDTTNEDPTYWEKVLIENQLEVVEEPEPIPINEDQLESLNAEAQEAQEEQPELDAAILPPVKASSDDWANEELRQKFDGRDSFMTGHSIKRKRMGTHECPEWAMDDKLCRKLLLFAFPKLMSDQRQRTAAGRWAAIIALYFRQELTYSETAEELKLSLANVQAIIKRIKWAAEGKTQWEIRKQKSAS